MMGRQCQALSVLMTVAEPAAQHGWHAAQWTALGALITAGVALIAAAFALVQVREARRLREEQSRPFVIVDIQPSETTKHILNIVIENVGKTLAKNVRLTFAPKLQTTMSGYDIANTALIKDGIATMPPGRRWEYLFDASNARFGSTLPMRYDVTVHYDDHDEKHQRPLRYLIDLTPLFGMHFIQEKGQHDIAKSLEEISKAVRGWSHQSGLRVWTRDEDRRNARTDAEVALTGVRPHMGRKPSSEILVWALSRATPIREFVDFLRRFIEGRRWGRRGPRDQDEVNLRD
jgi:hypothetical protein